MERTQIIRRVAPERMAAREPRSLTRERLRLEIQRPLGFQPGVSIRKAFFKSLVSAR